MQEAKDEHSVCDTSSRASDTATKNTSNNDNLTSDTEPEKQSMPENQSRSENEVNNVRQENNSPAIDCSIIDRINKLEECMSSILTIQIETMENWLTEMKKVKQQFIETQKLIRTENVKEARIIEHAENTDEYKNVKIIRELEQCAFSFLGREKKDVQEWAYMKPFLRSAFELNDDESGNAAIQQLRDRAPSLFIRQPSYAEIEWENFKLETLRYINDKMAMATMKERSWKINDEKFKDYATDKLNLIKSMGLDSPCQQIDLLIEGVEVAKLRLALFNKTFTCPDECIKYVEKIMNDDIISAYIFEK